MKKLDENPITSRRKALRNKLFQLVSLYVLTRNPCSPLRAVVELNLNSEMETKGSNKFKLNSRISKYKVTGNLATLKFFLKVGLQTIRITR